MSVSPGGAFLVVSPGAVNHPLVAFCQREEPQFLRPRHRQSVQQNRLHRGDDHGIGADAERERADSNRSKSGALRERSCCIAKIGPQFIPQPRSPCRAAILF